MTETRTSRLLALALLTCVLLYAGLLRLDGSSNPMAHDHPVWLGIAASVTSSPLTDARLAWRHVAVPYVGGDPVNYLKFARECGISTPRTCASRISWRHTGRVDVDWDADVAGQLTSITFDC